MVNKKDLERKLKDWKTKYDNFEIKKEISDNVFKDEISLLKG